MGEIKISDDAIIRQIIWAVRDPGSIVPRNGHKESDDDWTTRAVRCVLGGRLLPSGGEVSTQYGVRWHATPGYGDEWDDWGFSDEAHAREEMASSSTPSTLLRRRTVTLPVEPVVSNTSEAPDG